MPNERVRRLARLEKRELSEIPAYWSKEERGRYLWHLLRDRGIDPSLLYALEYFPYRRCWLLTQETEAGCRLAPLGEALPHEKAVLFYAQISTELRRTALAAFASVAVRSVHFARFGCEYQLPPKPQETSPSELAQALGGTSGQGARVRFTSEGGWQAGLR